ncbi:MAG: hypothetical protein M1817_001734 [Caeruleum heppii]|nr:MAG: hypothetical protein M1817_001734 [Caeruleum heppii]
MARPKRKPKAQLRDESHLEFDQDDIGSLPPASASIPNDDLTSRPGVAEGPPKTRSGSTRTRQRAQASTIPSDDQLLEYVHHHSFNRDVLQSHTTSERRRYTREVYDFARANGCNAVRATQEVTKARLAYKKNRRVAKVLQWVELADARGSTMEAELSRLRDELGWDTDDLEGNFHTSDDTSTELSGEIADIEEVNVQQPPANARTDRMITNVKAGEGSSRRKRAYSGEQTNSGRDAGSTESQEAFVRDIPGQKAVSGPVKAHAQPLGRAARPVADRVAMTRTQRKRAHKRMKKAHLELPSSMPNMAHVDEVSDVGATTAKTTKSASPLNTSTEVRASTPSLSTQQTATKKRKRRRNKAKAVKGLGPRPLSTGMESSTSSRATKPSKSDSYRQNPAAEPRSGSPGHNHIKNDYREEESSQESLAQTLSDGSLQSSSSNAGESATETALNTHPEELCLAGIVNDAPTSNASGRSLGVDRRRRKSANQKGHDQWPLAQRPYWDKENFHSPKDSLK